jgi:hypothetical protein
VWDRPSRGVEAEQELAFAALHQVCAPMLDRLDRLPVPQRDALNTAFGLSAGNPPDRFMVGLGVLGLLSDLAREEPVLCLVDDAQWLDRASAQVLGFAARRVRAESVAMIFAVRTAAATVSCRTSQVCRTCSSPDWPTTTPAHC